MANNLLFGRESGTDQEGKMFRVMNLTDEQRNLLDTTVRLHPKAYVRERAAAIQARSRATGSQSCGAPSYLSASNPPY